MIFLMAYFKYLKNFKSTIGFFCAYYETYIKLLIVITVYSKLITSIAYKNSTFLVFPHFILTAEYTLFFENTKVFIKIKKIELK